MHFTHLPSFLSLTSTSIFMTKVLVVKVNRKEEFCVCVYTLQACWIFSCPSPLPQPSPSFPHFPFSSPFSLKRKSKRQREREKQKERERERERERHDISPDFSTFYLQCYNSNLPKHSSYDSL